MCGVRPSRLDTLHKWIEVSVSWSVGLSPDEWSEGRVHGSDGVVWVGDVEKKTCSKTHEVSAPRTKGLLS
jgi:hypothetical protein